MIIVAQGLEKEELQQLRTLILKRYNKTEYWDKFRIFSKEQVLDEVMFTLDPDWDRGLHEQWQNDLVSSSQDLRKMVKHSLVTFIDPLVWFKAILSRARDNFIISSTLDKDEYEIVAQTACVIVKQACDIPHHFILRSNNMESIANSLPLPRLL